MEKENIFFVEEKKKGEGKGGKYYSFDQLGCSSCSMWSG